MTLHDEEAPVTEQIRTDHLEVRLDVVRSNALDKSCKSFVQPQIVPPSHCHQVAEPLQHTTAQNKWQDGLSLWLIGTVLAEPETVISRAWVQSPDPAE